MRDRTDSVPHMRNLFERMARPANKRQALLDRFQEDETVRVFLANIIAGGIGLNLTAASQVVFNDLDWVPANHWQAEDRAYRIGQTRTVNVTYLVGTGTVDDFVQAVLETKRALVMPSWRARRWPRPAACSMNWSGRCERFHQALPTLRPPPVMRTSSSGSSGTHPPRCGRMNLARKRTLPRGAPRISTRFGVRWRRSRACCPARQSIATGSPARRSEVLTISSRRTAQM